MRKDGVKTLLQNRKMEIPCRRHLFLLVTDICMWILVWNTQVFTEYFQLLSLGLVTIKRSSVCGVWQAHQTTENVW